MVRPLVRAGFLALALSVSLGAGVVVSALPVAAAAQAVPVEERAAEVERIREYLNSIKSLRAEFQQQAGRRSSSGTLWAERPGKVRFEYDPPSPILIVSSGDDLAYYDQKLETVNYIPQRRTPAWFLLAPEVELDGRFTVSQMWREEGRLNVTFVRSDNPDDGALTLFFREEPMQLQGWSVEDVGGSTTTVSLTNVLTGVYIPESHFNFRPPIRSGGN